MVRGIFDCIQIMECRYHGISYRLTLEMKRRYPTRVLSVLHGFLRYPGRIHSILEYPRIGSAWSQSNIVTLAEYPRLKIEGISRFTPRNPLFNINVAKKRPWDTLQNWNTLAWVLHDPNPDFDRIPSKTGIPSHGMQKTDTESSLDQGFKRQGSPQKPLKVKPYCQRSIQSLWNASTTILLFRKLIYE